MTLYIEQFKSPHSEPRRNGKTPRFLVLHYSGCPGDWMHDCFMGTAHDEAVGRVSAHYVVFENGHINQYVHENMRAWHAGAAYWDGETDLNSTSIGIELVNMGSYGGNPDFTEAQIAAAILLCQDIVRRRPEITPFNVLGHSDIAPGRKPDPGPKFPWARLARSGIGIMPEETTAYLMENDVGRSLDALGYNPEVPLDVRLQAFCEHYAPEGLGPAGFAAAYFKLWQMVALKQDFARRR